MDKFSSSRKLVLLVPCLAGAKGKVNGAAGQGKTTFQILGPETMWYWFQERDDSPWYPGLRQFRAALPYRWDDALDAVAEAVRGLQQTPAQPGEAAPKRRKRRPRIVRASPKA